MRKFAASSSTNRGLISCGSALATATRSVASNPNSNASEAEIGQRLSSSTHQQQNTSSGAPTLITVTPSATNMTAAPISRAELFSTFMTTFAKSVVTETIAHTAMTRKAVRSWTRAVTGRPTAGRHGIARRSKASSAQLPASMTEAELAQMATLRSLAIRAPKVGGGTESVPTPTPATGDKPAEGATPKEAGKDAGDKKTPPAKAPEGADKPKDPAPTAGGASSTPEAAAADKKGSSKKKGSGDDDEDDEPFEVEPDTITPMVTKFVLAVFVLSGFLYYFSKPTGQLSSWESLAQRTDALVRVDIYQEFAEFHFAEGPSVHVGLLYDDGHTETKLRELISKLTLADGFSTNYIGESFSESMLHFVGVFAWIVPFVFFPSFVMILTRAIGTAMTGVQESKNKVTTKVMFHVQKGSNTRFTDIAGMTEAKQEVTEIVDFLKHPDRYTRLGAKVPTGALLLGPPGTGKTLLAKAVAGEAGVAFIPCTGSDFVELYVGMGALRVRQLFELAKKQRCIIYIDEIDAIGLKRSGAGHGEKQEQEHTLNELLTQLDGFGSNRGEVMILASSNVSQGELDPALIRPGRFDRLVNVDAPVIKERIDIFKVHLSNLRLVAPPTTNPAVVLGTEGAAAAGTAAATPTSDTTTSTAAETAKTESAAAKIGESLSADREATIGTTTATPIVAAEAEAAKPSATTTEKAAITEEKPAEESNDKKADKRPTLAPATTTSHYDDMVAEHEAGQNVARRKMEAAATTALEEKLSKLTAEERGLVEQYAVRMADLCPGFVGADIMNVCNEAAILAAREDCTHVTISHLERSIDRVLAGIEHRSRVLSPFEKNVVAHHEAGHAVAGWFLGRADPLMKVSIVPRGGSALGYAQYLPNENQLRTSNEIKDSICVTLGGRVAEKIFFDHLSTGASDDLRKVTRMAYMHVSSFNTTTAHHAPGTSSTKYVKPFGAAISDKIDVAAKQLVDDMFDRTMVLLTEKKDLMEKLAKHLLEHEVLTHADVVAYLGPRPPRPSDKRKYIVPSDKAAAAAPATPAASN